MNVGGLKTQSLTKKEKPFSIFSTIFLSVQYIGNNKKIKKIYFLNGPHLDGPITSLTNHSLVFKGSSYSFNFENIFFKKLKNDEKIKVIAYR
jgi:sRNA-binding regulator protein Hfq